MMFRQGQSCWQVGICRLELDVNHLALLVSQAGPREADVTLECSAENQVRTHLDSTVAEVEYYILELNTH